MKSSFLLRVIGLVALLAGATVAAQSATRAQSSTGNAQEVVDIIIEEVIDRTVEAARDEVRRNTGVDPLKRGYDPRRTYEPVHAGVSAETRRELQQLNEEHDRTITQLETELQNKLDKAEAEFLREAEKEDKPEKVTEKRDKLQAKADEAYAMFEEKVGEENARFDEKRQEILSRERRG